MSLSADGDEQGPRRALFWQSARPATTVAVMPQAMSVFVHPPARPRRSLAPTSMVKLQDKSGTSIVLSANGAILAVGAPDNASSGVHYTYAGHVRVHGSSWTQLGADIDGEFFDRSGTSVALLWPSARPTMTSVRTFRI